MGSKPPEASIIPKGYIDPIGIPMRLRLWLCISAIVRNLHYASNLWGKFSGVKVPSAIKDFAFGDSKPTVSRLPLRSRAICYATNFDSIVVYLFLIED